MAIVMRACGPPSVLALEPVPRAPLKPDEIAIRGLASAVNHSDLEIRAGNWPIRRPDPFPYVPGLEVVGRVDAVGTDVRDVRPGDLAITMMQGLGGVRAERPGGYAELVVVRAPSAAVLPAGTDPRSIASLGLAGVTALEGLDRLGPLTGRRIVVTGASGGVGSAAIALAHARGAQVTAVVSRESRIDHARALGAEDVLVYTDVARGALGTGSVDGILDAVAGEAFAALVSALKPGGTLSLVGAAAGSDVRLDAYSLLDVRLTGYSSESLDGPALRRAIGEIAAALSAGRLKAPPVTGFPLRDARAAHEALEAHAIEGRVLLLPDPA